MVPGNGNGTMVMQRFPVGANKWSELSKKVMSSELDNNFREKKSLVLAEHQTCHKQFKISSCFLKRIFHGSMRLVQIHGSPYNFVMIWLLCHAICDVFPQYLEIKKWWSKILASGTSVSKTSQVLLCLFFCEIFMAYFWDTFFKLDFPLVSLGSWQTGNLFVTLFVDIFLTFLSHFLRHFFFYVWFSRLCLSNRDRPGVSLWHFLGHFLGFFCDIFVTLFRHFFFYVGFSRLCL